MLVPRFLLTKTVPITILRRTADTIVSGRVVVGAAVEVPRDVNIQPLKPSEIMVMPESERSKEWYKVYCAEDIKSLKEGVGGWPADEFVWQGETYRVMKVLNFAMGTLDHWKAFCAKVSTTPN